MQQHSFVGRFSLTSLQATRAAVPKDPGNQSGGYLMAPSVRVTLAAIKDGDAEDSVFRYYTPAGQIDMTISNPEVSNRLNEDWRGYLATEAESESYPDASLGQPVYEVTFRRIR